MPQIPPDQLTAALADVLREQLVQGEAFHVPGLGTFRTDHHESMIEEQPDGQVVMQPPRDEVVFSPDPE